MSGRGFFARLGWRTQLGLAAGGALGGALVGALDTALASRAAPLAAKGGGAAVGAAAGIVVTLASAPLLALAGACLDRLSQRLDLDRHFDRDAVDRAPVIELHRAVAGWVAFAIVLAGGTIATLAALKSIQEQATKEALTVVGVLGSMVVALLARAIASFVAGWALVRLDQKVRLPLPASSRRRWIVYLAIPTALACFVVAPVAARTGGLVLAVSFVELAAVASIFAEGFAWIAARRARLALVLSVAVVVCAGVVAGVVGSRWNNKTLAGVERAPTASSALWLVRRLTDVDFDGSSTLFGERDCAGWNARIHPGAREIAKNGIDENCDGRDGGDDLLDIGPVFYGALPPEQVKPYNVVWFIVDAVRADHCAFLGYDKNTTPYLSKLAKSSIVFSRAYSQASMTQLSIPSMLSGADPGRMSWEEHSGRLQPDEPQVGRLMVHRLKEAGYRTGAVITPYFDIIPSMFGDFDEVTKATRDQHDTPGQAGALSVSFLERAMLEKKPFFLLSYSVAPHIPYVKHGEGYPDFSSDDKGRYDSEIAAADRAIGSVLETLQAHPDVWNETVVIMVSDHGEEFREHGNTSHSHSCYDESVHVPLLLRVPGMEGQVIDRRVALVDVAPTLIELLGLDAPPAGTLDGHSLFQTIHDPAALDPDRPIFCNVVNVEGGRMFRRRSIRTADWLLTEEVTPSGEKQLFDLGADPGERHPLDAAGARASTANELSKTLSDVMTGNLGAVEMK